MSKYIEEIELSDFFLWKKIENKRMPLSGEIELTERCNNNCVHCYINVPRDDEEAKRRELSFDEIRSIIDAAQRLGCLYWLLTGGEPLLREDFSKIYLYLKKKGLLVSVFTNATLVTPEITRLFKDYPPRDIEITVYGVTKETYERVTRAPGSFKAFIRGIKLLLKENIPIRLKAMALRSNICEFGAIKKFTSALTKDYFRWDPFLHLRLRQDKKKNERIRRERLLPEDVAGMELADEDRHKALEERFCRKELGLNGKGSSYLFQCGAGNKSFAIDPYGFLKLCGALSAPECAYNLRQGTFAEAWREFVPTVHSLTVNNEKCVTDCLGCSLKNLCMWCPAHAYLECGKLDGFVEDFCLLAHRRKEALGGKK